MENKNNPLQKEYLSLLKYLGNKDIILEKPIKFNLK